MGCGGSKSNTAAPPAAPAKTEVKKQPFALSYDLKERLGKGQFAIVYKAVNKKSNAIVAAKVMQKSALTPEDIAALAVEVRAMELLSEHPNFVKYYDFYDEKDHFFLVMELITGGELFDRICEKERYTEREARDLVRQLVEAIAYAHSRGVVHRDLKPENILLKSRTDDTSIKLADLGFAKVISSQNPMMTTPCGTPGYVAPEILSGKPYTSKVDIWSLGVIFYILMCGYPPFASERDDQRELFAMIKEGRYSFDPREWGSISEGAKDLIRNILVVDPARRYTAEQILAHPWMRADATAIPDVALGATIDQLKRFNARRRLKSAINTVRSTVRMRMLLAANRTATEDDATAGVTPSARSTNGTSPAGAGAGATPLAGAGTGAGSGASTPSHSAAVAAVGPGALAAIAQRAAQQKAAANPMRMV